MNSIYSNNIIIFFIEKELKKDLDPKIIDKIKKVIDIEKIIKSEK